MEVGIVGLPQSGKTTVFNALTRGTAIVSSYASDGKPNVGVAKVSDSRLTALAEFFKSERTVMSEVTYFDLPARPGSDDGAGISGERLTHLQRAAALVLTVRAFENPSVPLPPKGIDPLRDARALRDELTLADLEVLERRSTRLEEGLKGAKSSEREGLIRERETVEGVRADLEDGTPVRDQKLSADAERALSGFKLLTAKPVVVLANVDEDGIAEMATLEEGLESELSVRAAALCGQLEMELAQMDAADEEEFRASMGLGKSGLDRMITLTHDVLDLITFFSASDQEARSWTMSRGSTALNFAEMIHSDIAKGFIRAETVGLDDLLRCGSIAESRKQGLLRQEGKGYLVKEGDVLKVLFNV